MKAHIRAQAVTAFQRRGGHILTRITLGLGIVALILGNRYMHAHHGAETWEIIGGGGLVLFAVSLLFRIYDTVLKYRLRTGSVLPGAGSELAELKTNRSVEEEAGTGPAIL
jgi:hypothetical protein